VSECLTDLDVLGIVEGSTSPPRREELLAHSDGCVACRTLLVAVGRALPRAGEQEDGEVVARGAVVGRYVVTDLIGVGATSEVHGAFDPVLERKIALKLLREDAGSHERLVREGVTMARLSHPNVVPVFDVGTHGKRVYVAMEYVQGRTLRAWLDERDRSWREIAAAFAHAGRGLAAAHAESIVHRDFKPENVLVGRDERVRVVDFGLSHTGDAGAAPQLAGTPVYMAPELLDGEPAAPSHDQFAFCVTLYEALYGVRPFAGDTLEDIAARAKIGAFAPPLVKRRVPALLHRAVTRGLAARPRDRFPSMSELVHVLDRLERGPIAQRRVLLAGAAFAVAIAAIVGLAVVRRPAPPVCTGARDRLAGIWDPAVKATVRAAFAATGRTYAPAVADHVDAALDRYSDAWVAMRTDACEATAVREEQSPALLDLRMHCLDRRRDQLGALTALFAKEPDPRVLDRAVGATTELDTIAGCADAAALTFAYPPPDAPLVRAQVDALHARVDRAQALLAAGRGKDGLELARAAVDDARRLGYPPVLAEALTVLGNLEKEAVPKEAEATLKDALAAAAAAHDDLRAAQALTELVWFVGYRMHRPVEARSLRAPAEAAIVRAGDQPLMRANLLYNLGANEDAAGVPADALRFHRQALALREQVLGRDHPSVARSLVSIGNVLTRSGHYPEGRASFERALAIGMQSFAPTHPFVGAVLANLGDLANQQGRYAESADYDRRALVIFEQNLGVDHPNVAVALMNLGNAEASLRHFEVAAAAQERALAIRRKAFGDNSPEVAAAMNVLAGTYPHVNRFAEAIALAERSAALREKLLGPEHPDLAWTLDNLGGLHLDHGDFRQALPVLQRALAIREKAYGLDNVRIAESRMHLAECYLGIGEVARATSLADASLPILVKAGDEPIEVARASFVLAQARLAREPERAYQLADEAHRILTEAVGDNAELLAKIDRWRELHHAAVR
jgi:eukaryotic-like serine/threonine-protein kinase